MRRRRLAPVVGDRAAFVVYRFPPEMIMLAVCWYCGFGLSYRDLEELLCVEVDHVILYRWVRRFAPLLGDTARPRRHGVVAGGSWTRPTCRWPADGATCTGPSTSTAR